MINSLLIMIFIFLLNNRVIFTCKLLISNLFSFMQVINDKNFIINRTSKILIQNYYLFILLYYNNCIYSHICIVIIVETFYTCTIIIIIAIIIEFTFRSCDLSIINYYFTCFQYWKNQIKERKLKISYIRYNLLL